MGGTIKRRSVVCFLNHTAETGGAELALLRLAASMERESWHPVVVFGEDGPAAELFRQKSLETYVLPLAPSVGRIRRRSLCGAGLLSARSAGIALAYMWKLAGFLRERAVEMVHSNSMKAHVLGGVAARLAGIPVVWHLRDALHPSHLPGPALMGMRCLAKVLPSRILCVSECVAREALGDAWRTRAEVVYDGLEDEAFESPVVLDPQKRGIPWRVGIAGRLSTWKGQHVFLEAAVKLLERGHQIQFEILGGPLFGEEAYASRLQDFVRDNGLTAHVNFAGHVGDVPARIRSWDVFVHASTAPDPCPNVVLEAMAAGVPVVASDGGGVPELLEDGLCGTLFAPDDPRALCASIESLFENGRERVKKAGRARCRALRRFRAERVGREVCRVWADLFDARVFERRGRPWLDAPFLEAGDGAAGDSDKPARTTPGKWPAKADPRI